AGGILSCRVHYPGTVEPAGAGQQGDRLQDPVSDQRRNAADHRPRPQTSGRRDRLLLHPAHLGTESAAPSACALRGHWRRSESGPEDLDRVPPRLLSQCAGAIAVVPAVVPVGVAGSFPAKPAEVPRTTPGAGNFATAVAQSTKQNRMGSLCQAAVWRSQSGAGIPGPLHAPGGALQRPAVEREGGRSYLPVQGLPFAPSAQIPLDDSDGRRVHPPLSAARHSTRLSAHPPLRIAGQPEQEADTGAVPPVARHRMRAAPYPGRDGELPPAGAGGGATVPAMRPWVNGSHRHDPGLPLAQSTGFLMTGRSQVTPSLVPRLAACGGWLAVWLVPGPHTNRNRNGGSRSFPTYRTVVETGLGLHPHSPVDSSTPAFSLFHPVSGQAEFHSIPIPPIYVAV